MTTREEWDNYTDDEKFQSLQLTEKDNAEMRSVLEEVPECPQHGFCLPHAREWIKYAVYQKGQEAQKFLAQYPLIFGGSK